MGQVRDSRFPNSSTLLLPSPTNPSVFYCTGEDMGSQRNITLPSNIGPFLLESLPSGGSAAEDREYLLLPWCCPLCSFSYSGHFYSSLCYC